MNRRLLVFGLALLLGLSMSGVAMAKDLVVIRSNLTESATANYPSYGASIDRLIEFLEEEYDFTVMTDSDVIAGKLAGAKLVILNDQGVMNDAEVSALRKFVDGGGKVFATFSTSIRNAALQNVGFQLADIYGVKWSTWTQDPTFEKVVIVNDHPIVKGFGQEIAIGAGSLHKITVENATVLGVRANAAGAYASVADNATLTVSNGGVYVGFSLLTSTYFEDEAGSSLIRAIIDHYAPGARR